MTLNKKYLSWSLNGLSHMETSEPQMNKSWAWLWSKIIGFLESQCLEVMGRARPCISQLWIHFIDQQPLWGPPGTELKVEDAWLQHMGMSGYVVFFLKWTVSVASFFPERRQSCWPGRADKNLDNCARCRDFFWPLFPSKTLKSYHFTLPRF